VGERLDLSRVHFVGRIPYADLLDLIRVGRAHVYLTYPFVLSWSMMEAMSLGAYVIASRTPPVEEMIEDGVTGRLVDFFDVEAWAEALIAAMAEPEAQAPIRAAARAHIVQTYDLKTVCLPRLMRFVETAGT
jgi:glycosyltransferase involved in cell wall biosynthesis